MKKTLEEIGDASIAYARYPSPAEDAPDQVTADSYDLGYLVEDEPDRAWEVIKYIVSRYSEADLVSPDQTEANKVVGLLAAGPLEDFLSFHGADYIERVEAEANRDRRMAWALGGVWQFTMTDAVWSRVQRAAIQWVR